MKFGFKQVDCCKYKENNFVSSVYAYWKEGCKYNSLMLFWKYYQKRFVLAFRS